MMVIKAHQNVPDSSKAKVGEIDTRAPFESVKAAVSLFGEGTIAAEESTHKKTKTFQTERVFATETLQLAQKELNKFKEQLKLAEHTRYQTLTELNIAKKTVEDLTGKLRTVNECKDSAIKETEASKNKVKQLADANFNTSTLNGGAWKSELDTMREQYLVATAELDLAKQELRKMQQEFDTAMGAKASGISQATESEHAVKVNSERANDLLKEITSIQESLIQLKLATVQAQEEQTKTLSQKDAIKQSSIHQLEETQKKLVSFKKDFDPELCRNLEAKLAKTSVEIEHLEKDIEKARIDDLDSVKNVTTDLDDAKEVLQKVAAEESSLKSLVASLKLELETVKKEHSELKEKESEIESIAGNLHVKLRKSKDDLEASMAAESKARDVSDEMLSTLCQLSLESENAKEEAETTKNTIENLKKEAEATRTVLNEVEMKLQIALKEAEEAKASEAIALDRIGILSEKTNASRLSTSESDSQIMISVEEFESLSRKVEESNNLMELKVAAAIAQVEAIRACEKEAIKRWEICQKEIEEMEKMRSEALRSADMADAAKKAVEGELRKWRERDQKKASEAASRILVEREKSHEMSPSRINPPVKDDRKLNIEKLFSTKKTILPNLSIFQRKKNQVEGGSPSHLPSEKRV